MSALLQVSIKSALFKEQNARFLMTVRTSVSANGQPVIHRTDISEITTSPIFNLFNFNLQSSNQPANLNHSLILRLLRHRLPSISQLPLLWQLLISPSWTCQIGKLLHCLKSVLRIKFSRLSALRSVSLPSKLSSTVKTFLFMSSANLWSRNSTCLPTLRP